MYELEKTNNATVMRSFNNCCAALWPDGIQYEKVQLVLTDQASYMLLAFSNLKMMYTNLKHVTCLAHAIHRVCEAIREEHSKADDFIAQISKLMLKAPSRIQIYNAITCTELICISILLFHILMKF